MIKVEYTGEYPSTCMGKLTIYDDDVLVYDEMYCCHSTGSSYIDCEHNEHVESGMLLWNEDEAIKFSKEIRHAVAEKLSEYSVCCGGCL